MRFADGPEVADVASYIATLTSTQGTNGVINCLITYRTANELATRSEVFQLKEIQHQAVEVKVAELTVNMERNLKEDIAAKFSQMSEQLQSMNQTQIDSSITMNTKLQAQADGIKQHQASMTAATIGTALSTGV